jgi:hypothetical protein
VSKEEADIAKSFTWCPKLISQPPIINLFNKTPVQKYVKSAIGTASFQGSYSSSSYTIYLIAHPIAMGQIALRFPGTLCTDDKNFCPVPWWNK